jgi:hypothetical protein
VVLRFEIGQLENSLNYIIAKAISHKVVEVHSGVTQHTFKKLSSLLIWQILHLEPLLYESAALLVRATQEHVSLCNEKRKTLEVGCKHLVHSSEVTVLRWHCKYERLRFRSKLLCIRHR